MNKEVLLIDDDQDDMEIFVEALKTLGININPSWANSAEQAFARLKKATPDYVFVDYNMSPIDGLACLSELRKLRNLEQSTIVLYSTTLNRDLRKKAFHRGATFCLQKQNSVSDLAESMKFIFNPVNTRLRH